METKIQMEFIDSGFGFPVRLRNVPMVKIRGIWTPKMNYINLAQAVLYSLAFKTSRLTGNEIKFIRTHFEMTLQAFAKRFCVSHAAVLKWEKVKNKPTIMSWSMEKDIRLFVLSKLRVKLVLIAQLYAKLESIPQKKSAPIELDVEDLAA